MKKLILISLLILCGCSTGTDNYRHDRSLTGSISYRYNAEIEGMFDGVSFSDKYGFHYRGSHCSFNKATAGYVTFDCEIYISKKTKLLIQTPQFLVYGKPYDVTFEDGFSDSWVQYYENSDDIYTGYNNVEGSIKGWMKEKTGEWALTRGGRVYPSYDCDITINCTIDGKELELKITKLEGIAL